MNHLLPKAHDALESCELNSPDTCDNAKVSKLAEAIRFNGSGNINHEFFWEGLAPITEGGGVIPEEQSELRMKIASSFGTFDNFVS